MGATLAEKVWADHVVKRGENGAPDLLFIDLQLVHYPGELFHLLPRIELRLVADEIVDSLPSHQLGDGVGPEVEILPHLGGRCAEAQPGGDLRLT